MQLLLLVSKSFLLMVLWPFDSPLVTALGDNENL